MRVVYLFVNTVDQLINQRLPNGGRLFIETKGKDYINFRPKDFRVKLQHLAGEKNINRYLGFYKELGFIITNEKDSFTNVQRLRNKVLRVITVDRRKFEALKTLAKEVNCREA